MKTMFNSTKTVDQVMSAFNKAIDDLRGIQDTQSKKAADLFVQHQAASQEAHRASTIADKLGKLVGA